MNFYNKNYTLIVFFQFCIFFILSLGSVYLTFIDWDEAAMMSEAFAMTKGQILYKDIYHIHPIFQFFIFIPFFLFFNSSLSPHLIKIFNLLLIFSGSLIVKKSIYKIFKDRLNAEISSILFLLIFIFFEWSKSSYGEFYAIFPMLLSLYFLFLKNERNKISLFISGICFGTSIFFKQTSFFDIFPIILTYLFFEKSNKLKSLTIILSGMFLIFTTSMIYPILNNSVNETISSVFLKNVSSYIKFDANKQNFLIKILQYIIKTFFIFKESINEFFLHNSIKFITLIFTIFFLFNILKNGFSYLNSFLKQFIFALFWIFCIISGLSIIGRFYTHYIIQLIPPFIFIFSILFNYLNKNQKYILTFLIAILIFLNSFKVIKEMPAKIRVAKIKKQSSLIISEFIKKNSSFKDTIFLYNIEDLSIFYLSERLSCNGIYMYTDMDHKHTGNLQAENILKNKFINNLPKLFLICEYNIPENDSLNLFFNKILKNHYTFKRKINDITIYERR